MSNDWLRLWHDMPTDPKWRTIARVSGQRIGDVMSVYLFLLVSGSTNATERGRTQSFNAEDVATALDLQTDAVESIVVAMQGRVLSGDMLRGWVGRQPAREDGAAERAKAWREAQKEAKRTQANASERKRTLDTDTDTDTEEAKDDSLTGIVIDASAPTTGEPDSVDDVPKDLVGVVPAKRKKTAAIPCPAQEILDMWDRILCPEAAAVVEWNDGRARTLAARWKDRVEIEGWQSKADGLKWFEGLFAECRRSRFLMGKVPPRNGSLPFKLKFDWFFGRENFTRVLEGDFHRGN